MEAQFEPSFRTDLDDFSPLSPLSKDPFWVAPSSGREKAVKAKITEKHCDEYNFNDILVGGFNPSEKH